MIAVFGYSFPHQKTQDFLFELKVLGLEEIVLIAAPWKRLQFSDSTEYFDKNLDSPYALHPKSICKALSIRYLEIEHDDFFAIRDLVKSHDIKFGIVSGARIIKANIIKLFAGGIVNFHPGKLPETSGLDAFFYTIKKGVSPGVTTHFINELVDAGNLIEFTECNVTLKHTPEHIVHNLYTLQIKALRSFVRLMLSNNLTTSPIVRPSKNSPLKVSEKFDVMLNFKDWRRKIYSNQSFDNLLSACEEGHLSVVKKIIGEQKDLIFRFNEKGWTPLVVSAFNQHFEVVKFLLESGANPNSFGNNGTSVLMYAKTALLNDSDPDFSILSLLIDYHADPHHSDNFGKTIFDYVKDSPNLLSFFEAYRR